MILMATSTFDKRIIIDDEAADVLIALLQKPAPPRPDVSKFFRELTGEDDRCFLQNRLRHLSAQKQKEQ
jgi:hypothetical protein